VPCSLLRGNYHPEATVDDGSCGQGPCSSSSSDNGSTHYNYGSYEPLNRGAAVSNDENPAAEEEEEEGEQEERVDDDEQPPPPIDWCEKRLLWSHFIYINDDFTKTGSGQT
jgi:hypothetical protein